MPKARAPRHSGQYSRRGSKPIIGVAGGVGSGKSTITRQMGSMGAQVIDADAMAQEALNRPEVRQRLVQWWGPDILGPDGSPDRRRIADVIFSDPEQRKRLESLIHPMVEVQRQAQIRQAMEDPKVRAIVLDVPLLFEVGLDKMCDHIVFVEADRALRQERLKRDRGWDGQELDRREKNQTDLEMKKSSSDAIIDNNHSESECLEQVRNLFDLIIA